jgi:hypothetical protein
MKDRKLNPRRISNGEPKKKNKSKMTEDDTLCHASVGNPSRRCLIRGETYLCSLHEFTTWPCAMEDCENYGSKNQSMCWEHEPEPSDEDIKLAAASLAIQFLKDEIKNSQRQHRFECIIIMLVTLVCSLFF